MSENPCPCGSTQTFATCCAPLLDGTDLARTPEQLMRSRYTAFHQGNVEYLFATRHPSQREPDERRTLTETVAQTEWLSLRVLSAVGNTVEFMAFYRQNGALNQIHEKSAFVYEDGYWYYLEGIFLEPVLLGRNAPCWCGSGKKLKKCHGK